jgi:hypothetical protein
MMKAKTNTPATVISTLPLVDLNVVGLNYLLSIILLLILHQAL